MSMNKITIEGYTKDIAATGTPVDATAPSGAKHKYALDVVIYCPAGNTSDLKIGSRARQEFTVKKGESVRMSTVMNKMSQSAKFLLGELFIKAGTNGDDVEIMLVGPANDGDDDF